MNRLHTTSLAALTVAGLLATGIGVTHATSGPSEGRPFEHLIQAVASRFNLDADAVKQVFDEECGRLRSERQAGMLDRHAERLDDAVAVAVITTAQKDLILAKFSETEALHERLRDMTFDERKDAIDTRRDEIRAWAAENGIPERLLPMAGRMGVDRGHGQGMKPGNGQGKARGVGMGFGDR